MSQAQQEEMNNESEDEEKKVSLSKENKELKEKLNQTCHKMMEYKSQCEILKQDLKKYQKALEKEVIYFIFKNFKRIFIEKN